MSQERYVKLSEVVEALRAEAVRAASGQYTGRASLTSAGFPLAADFLASSGLGVEGIEVQTGTMYYAEPEGEWSIKAYLPDGATLKPLLARPAILLLPTEEGE